MSRDPGQAVVDVGADWLSLLAHTGSLYVRNRQPIPLARCVTRIVDAGFGQLVGMAAAHWLLNPGRPAGELYVPPDARPAIRQAMVLLARGRLNEYERWLLSAPKDAAKEILAVLGGNLARLDPDGRRIRQLAGAVQNAVVASPVTEPGAWSPNPKQLPEWRRRLVRDSRRTALYGALTAGKFTLAPDLEPAEAAHVLAVQEERRLSRARLYWVDEDMCAVVGRSAGRARKAPLSQRRVPHPYGLIVLSEPLDPAPGEVRPVVAFSWGEWKLDTPPAPPGTRWLTQTRGNPLSLLNLDGNRAWWVTAYTQVQGSVPLGWDDESCLREGHVWKEPPEQGTRAVLLRSLVGCWDLITQERVATRVTDTEVLTRKPSDVRADRRRGIEDDGSVHVVSIRGRRPNAAKSRQRDEGKATRDYRHRWWVGEHERDHCMNPKLHKDNGCTHEQITILDYPKGPDGAPFLMREKVHALRGNR